MRGGSCLALGGLDRDGLEKVEESRFLLAHQSILAGHLKNHEVAP